MHLTISISSFFQDDLLTHSIALQILAVDRALKEPRLMLAKYGIVNVGILIPCLISTAFGIVGYWSFGTGEENILRSLPLDEMWDLTQYLNHARAIPVMLASYRLPTLDDSMELFCKHFGVTLNKDLSEILIYDRSTKLNNLCSMEWNS